MAKRVIQMYDKYKSTTKTYPKIIKECLQKDVTDFIEGQVEANPTLAGTEASLTGLQIGDTKYKIGGGKQLYQHNIILSYTFSNTTKMKVYPIITDINKAFTNQTFAKYLYDNNFKSKDNCWGLNGYHNLSGDVYFDGVFSLNGTSVKIYSTRVDLSYDIVNDIVDNFITL